MSDPRGDRVEGPRQAGDRRRRRRRRWLWPLVVIIVLAAAGGVFLAVQDSRTVAVQSISPAQDALLNSRPLTISCELSRFVPDRGTLTVTVDGRPVPDAALTLSPGLVQAQLELADGPHTVAVAHVSGRLFTRHVERIWDFTVDTTAPVISVRSPSSFPLLTARSSEISFTLSEAAIAFLTLDGKELPPAGSGMAATSAKASLVTSEGQHRLRLTATDQAGNTTAEEWDLVVDYKAPKLAVEGLPDNEIWKEQNSAAVALAISDHFADQVELTATLDGSPLTLEERPASTGTRALGFDTGTLAEGTHAIAVRVIDPGGHVATFEREFLVDTSSTFGSHALKAGAQGDDVKQLQRILKIRGVYDGEPTGVLDEPTAVAVAAFNSQRGLSGGDVVTKQTLKHLLGYIRIDLSERKLYFYGGDDELIESYRVAVGMSAYPTPTGAFRIINKERNPTWNPPNSAWAAGLKPVPPGPNNPLGTRWMGLNSPGIGIHGTPAPSSIGTAASHGCIRMKIPEVEELFDRVFVGTPVEIVK